METRTSAYNFSPIDERNFYYNVERNIKWVYDNYYRWSCNKRWKSEPNRKYITTNYYIDKYGQESCPITNWYWVCWINVSGDITFYNSPCIANKYWVQNIIENQPSLWSSSSKQKTQCDGIEMKPQNIICENAYHPMCGSDWVTYDNGCEFLKAQIEKPSLKIKKPRWRCSDIEIDINDFTTDWTLYQYIYHAPNTYFGMDQLYITMPETDKDQVRNLYVSISEKIQQTNSPEKTTTKLIYILQDNLNINKAYRFTNYPLNMDYETERKMRFLKDLLMRDGEEKKALR